MKEIALLLVPLLVTVVVLTAFRRNSVQSGANIRNELNLMEQQIAQTTGMVSQGQMPTMQGGAPVAGQATGLTQQAGSKPQSGPQTHSTVTSSGDDTTETCSCPEAMSENPCSVNGTAVLGGLDVVQYFTTFKLTDGSYNESMVGQVGSEDYSSSYDGFRYYFLTEENRDLFDAAPESYIPQWGGFCSWGVGYETCPPYPWAADCLGPSGNWGHWTIQNEKLYFFLFEAAKEKFMADPDTYIANGNSRWGSWFSDPYSHMSTHCYVEDPTATSTH
jgi:YHS domain-containing protein